MTALSLLLALAARVAIVDVGAGPAGPAVRAAAEASLQGSSVGDSGLRDALFGLGPLDRTRFDGEAALERAKAAFGALKCEQADKDLEAAERQLGALPAADVQSRIADIYKYRKACAANRGDEAQVTRLGALLEAMEGKAAPAPAPIELGVDPEPDDASILIDGREAGRGGHPLAPGPHLLDVEKPGFRKLHRLVDVQAPGPVRLAVTLAAQPSDAQAAVRAQVQSLRGAPMERHLSALSEIATRASADRVLLIDASGVLVQARLFDAEAGALDPRAWKGRVVQGALPGLGDFVAGRGGVDLSAGKPGKPNGAGKGKQDNTWGHWYSWAIAGALAGLATVLVLSATSSSDELTIKANH